MKYFDQHWCWGDLSDSELNKQSCDYANYIASVYSQLPFALKLLSKNIQLHDGRIEKIKMHRSKLILFGVFGDLETGYFKMQIEYRDVIEVDTNYINDVFSGKYIEIIQDEIEMAFNPIRFSHKLMLSNRSEFQIKFLDISIKIHSASSKQYRKRPCLIQS